MDAYDFAEEINASNVICMCYRCGRPATMSVYPEHFEYECTYTVHCNRCMEVEKSYTPNSILIMAARMTNNALFSRRMIEEYTKLKKGE